MAKILRIENRIVTIGLEDGSIEEYDIGCFIYPPSVNDEVRIYRKGDLTEIALTDTKHLVHKNTYALLGILLGGIGMNEFYAGYTGRGIACCMFGWTGVPEIVNLVKGIYALSRPSDHNGNIRV